MTMKRLIAIALMIIFAVSGCGSGNSTIEKIVKDDIEGLDSLEEKLDKKMKEIGIEEYEVTSHELTEYGDVLTECKTDNEKLQVYCSSTRHKSDPWTVDSIQDCDTKKYYYSTNKHHDVYDYTTGERTQEGAPYEMPKALSEGSSKISLIESSIRSHINKNYKDTDIDSITINNDSIALVHLTWNVKNTAGTTKDMLKMYSDDLAATMAAEHKELTEIAVFWKVPYLSSDCKWHYECKDGKAFMDDSFVNF